MKKSYTNLALEAIRHGANTTLFPRLTEVFDRLLEKANQGTPISVLDLDPLVPIVREELNLRVVMLSSDAKSYDFYTTLQDLDANSPMAQDMYRWVRSSEDGLRKLKKSNGVLRGAVDRNTGRVSGVFSDIKVPVCVGLGWFNAKQLYNGSELAAAFLHELGHNVTYFESIAETLTANAILLALAQDWLNSDRSTRVKLLDAVNETEVFGIDPKSRDAITQLDDVEKVVTVLATADYFTPRSMQNQALNDHSQFEAASDQFSARFGAGKSLATGLDKLYRSANIIPKNSQRTVLSILQGVAVSSAIAFAVAAAFVPVIAAPACILAAVGVIQKTAMFTLMTSNDQFDIYDSPRKRIERIVVEYKSALKNNKLPVEQTRKALQNLEEVDKLLSEYCESRSWGEVVLNAVFYTRGRMLDQRAREAMIEKLSSNDLYSVAAALRTQ